MQLENRKIALSWAYFDLVALTNDQLGLACNFMTSFSFLFYPHTTPPKKRKRKRKSQCTLISHFMSCRRKCMVVSLHKQKMHTFINTAVRLRNLYTKTIKITINNKIEGCDQRTKTSIWHLLFFLTFLVHRQRWI